ncbi:Cadherin 96Ca [Operophtera brumata]|uniref:Cadherin 96Ca n=1 Tax=Operophtera brumata TaxID=104452 RepID=A0A0L7KSE8_OPEBR|nr:Cadherin 96Ca [Operophtera brumata]
MKYQGSSQGPGFHLPAVMRVERNWFVMLTDPIGTFVTRVNRERTGSERVTYGLETSGPPAPFQIDPDTGVVTVNDTLIDKENRSYSLWVTAYDGSIPQRTEVYASVTDKSGQRRNPPHPPLSFPPFTIRPKASQPPMTYPVYIEPPKVLPSTTTKAVEDFTEESVPDTTATTTLSPPKPPDDIPKVEPKVEEKNTSVVKNEETTTEGALPLIPLIAISGLVTIVAVVMFFIYKKNQSPKPSSKKEDMSKDSSGIVLQDASLNMWERPRAYSNRYESWDNNHLQISEETETTITKEEPPDEWEFPRHRLRIFNIVGEVFEYQHIAQANFSMQ